MSRTFLVVANKIFTDDGSPDVSGDIESSKIYEGHNPMQAAKKIFTRIAKLSKSSECSYIFMIRETTIGKTHNKIFTYLGTKKRLDNPVDVSKGKSYFQVNYKSDIRSYKKNVPRCIIEDDEKYIDTDYNEPEISQEIIDKIPKEPEWFRVAKKIIPPY